MRLSFSKLKCYKDCPRKFKFKYIDHLPEPESPEQRLGTVGHKVLADYYSTIERSQELINALCTRHGIEDDLDEALREILGEYHEWARNHDLFKVLEVEQEYNKDNVNGKIDLLVEDQFSKVIIDHKFKANWAPNILEDLLHDEQTKTYAAFTGVQKVCYNLVRTTKVKTRPKYERVCVLVPRQEINRIPTEYVKWSEAIEKDSEFLRNRGYQCKWCPFKEQCYDYTGDTYE